MSISFESVSARRLVGATKGSTTAEPVTASVGSVGSVASPTSGALIAMESSSHAGELEQLVVDSVRACGVLCGGVCQLWAT